MRWRCVLRCIKPMIPIIDIDGDDIVIFKDADTLRWHREAWQFMERNGALPKMFTIEGGRVEHKLVEPENEQGEILLILGEPTHESIVEVTTILRSWVARWHPGYHPEGMELDHLVKFLPHWPEE